MPQEKTVEAINSYKKAIHDFEQIDSTTVLLIVLFSLTVILIIVVALFFGKSLRGKFKLKLFEKYAREKELDDKQIKILWEYSEYLNRDPFLTLEFKAPFEKVVNEYISHNKNFDENLIKDMRKKLGFDVVPELMPLVVTKDIDLFQTGTLITSAGLTYQVSLLDKDELYMFWLLMENEQDIGFSKGEVVRLTFTRKNDAVYNINVPVLDIIKENGKVILKFPHTFDLVRIQRREHPRVKVDIGAFIRKVRDDENIIEMIQKPTKWHYVNMHDISAGGTRICIPQEKRIDLNLHIDAKVELKFELDGKEIKVKGIIANINEKKKHVCYGIKFTDITKEIVEFLTKYVQKEQQNLLKAIKGKCEKWK